MEPGGRLHPGGATGAAALPSVCPAYKTVRPILLLAANTPVLPPRWREAIKLFIGVLDVVCP